MKRVLLLSYLFNDNEAIGSIRSQGLARFLPQLGWEPVILTVKTRERSPSHVRTIEIPYSSLMSKLKTRLSVPSTYKIADPPTAEGWRMRRDPIRMGLGVIDEIASFPFVEKGWYIMAARAAERVLRSEHVDAIVSTSAPVASHFIACRLKQKYDVPWVADLRDLWSQNHNIRYSSLKRKIEQKSETGTLESADALVTVSEPWAAELRLLHGNAIVYCVPNGFDPDLLLKSDRLHRKFSILYAGYVYEGRQQPEILFQALTRLSSRGLLDLQEIAVHIYGNNGDWLHRLVDKYALGKTVIVHGLVSRNEVLRNERKSHLLLLLTWNDPEMKGHYPAKVFEYLAARRPILSLGSAKGVIEDLLTSTNAGTTASNVEEAETEVLRYYDEFMRTGSVQYQGALGEIGRFSQEEMARKYSDILEAVTKQSEFCRHSLSG